GEREEEFFSEFTCPKYPLGVRGAKRPRSGGGRKEHRRGRALDMARGADHKPASGPGCESRAGFVLTAQSEGGASCPPNTETPDTGDGAAGRGEWKGKTHVCGPQDRRQAIQGAGGRRPAR